MTSSVTDNMSMIGAARRADEAIDDRFAAIERRVSNLEQQMRDRIMHELPDKEPPCSD